ncbi:uncharacterized protein LOC103313788 [Tribolium castaneum]|uniref:Uncharacterized protein n=1 Tax=Tribolium castaneum TaxID=7070 RepID=D6WUM5_TRICA|nr:PREDICTED: uncharacterized protein LOC103313788 [Tribolium castaneum]XP_015837879.1 PREDICTED: uncharacterized protein LOC103313788 [Tribolium castaneum]EFA08356.2 hypothetical protein TcasGA2_TC005999 [Tribolium castaneum]|eukprot:XP_008196175.1 PREDICTED: uncharacterized protein LOC103313788 [Tribolium castaneum]
MSVPPNAAPPEPINTESTGWKIFSAFIHDTPLSVPEEDLWTYVSDELKLDTQGIPYECREQLPLILVAFMNIWSGWHFKTDFREGKFPKEHYYHRFHKYMRHKLHTAIRGQLAVALKAVKDQQQRTAALVQAEPENKIDSDFSPFTIHVQCPANMLNTIVFSNVGDDIVMKQHLGGEWEELTTTQLLNWPHVEAIFRTKDICFVRRQRTEYLRYLNFLPHESVKHSESVIDNVEILPNYGNQRRCFSYNFFKAYFNTYLEFLEKLVAPVKFNEIQDILTQFLEDVKYINVNNSMVTNTSVSFRLSPVPFIRNKKLVKNSDNKLDSRVGYCEIITPQIELILVYCKAEQTDTPYLSFDFIEELKNSDKTEAVIMPSIVYRCTFCSVRFTSHDSKKMLLQHLKITHKMEQQVRCTYCKKHFNVPSLAANRWSHKCQPSQNSSVSRSNNAVSSTSGTSSEQTSITIN